MNMVFNSDAAIQSRLTLTRPIAVIVDEFDERFGTNRLNDRDGSWVSWSPKVLPAEVYASVSRDELRVWCVVRAFYGLPTCETVEWLATFMRDHDIERHQALEVGAGNGVFGRALGIRMTDSWVQTAPELRAVIVQPPVVYSDDVEQIEALDAVVKYEPKLIFGSWVTHRFDPKTETGFALGLQEQAMFRHGSVRAYVVLGNRAVHGHKPMLARKHQILQPPGLMSRSSRPQDDCFYVWAKADAPAVAFETVPCP